VAGGSSPDKFLLFFEEGFIPQPLVHSPFTLDHMIVEDCSDEDNYDEDEVDYSTSRGSSKLFRSPVPPSTGNNLAVPPTSVSRVPPVCGSGKSVAAAATSLQERSPPVPASIPSLAVAEPNIPTVVSPPTEASPSDISHPTAPVEKWRDLFATNRSTITGPKLPHFSSSCDDLPCDLFSDDLDNNYDVWQLCIVGYIAGKSPSFKALNNIISSSWKCEASLTIHESGWLVYRFTNVDDKLVVLAKGPYLIYGRPLIIKAMPEYFDFGTDEMSCVTK
jgi:hypothetical protein